MIELSHITKTIKNRKILNDITISFPNQGLFLIKGENGCGKSTLFNLLALLDKDYQGTYYFNGQEVRKLSSKQISILRFNDISYTTQKDNFIPYLSLEQNKQLYLYLDKKNPKISKDKKLVETSEGESLLAVIDGKLKEGRKLYLLDELLDHLDSKNRELVIKKILSLSKKALVIVVSHDSKLMSQYGTVIGMSEGKLITTEKAIPIDKERLSNNNKKKARFSFRLFSYSLKQSVLLPIFYFLLLLFGFGTCLTPAEAISYDYGKMLSRDVPIGSVIRVYDKNQELNELSNDKVFLSSYSLVFSNRIPDDGKVHLLYDTKKKDLANYTSLFKTHNFEYVLDDSLPFDGCFMNYQSYLAKSSLEKEELITLYKPSFFNQSESQDETSDSFKSDFGNTSIFSKSFGFNLNITLDDSTLYVFTNKYVDSPVYQYYSSSKNDSFDLSKIFSSDLKIKVLQPNEYISTQVINSERKVLLSDNNYNKLNEAITAANSSICLIDSSNKQKICSYIANKRLIPLFYQIDRGNDTQKMLKTNYVNMNKNKSNEKSDGILICILAIIYSVFIAIIYSKIEIFDHKKEIGILYQSGYEKKQVFLNLLLRQGIPVILASILGFFFSFIIWGGWDSNMFGYLPFPTWLCFTIGAAVIFIQIITLLISFVISERRKW